MGRMECKIVIITRREICWYKKQRDFFCLLDFFWRVPIQKSKFTKTSKTAEIAKLPIFGRLS